MLNNPVILAPPVGLGQMVEVEKQPVTVEHLMEEVKYDKLVYTHNERTRCFEGTLMDEKTIKFYFNSADVINPESMMVELEIANPNKYNYLQLDNSPHSLIKSTRWTYKNKIIENITDYNVLLSLLNDMTYQKNKYYLNYEYERNKNDDLFHLTAGSREDLLHPKIHGTEFSRSLFSLTSSESAPLRSQSTYLSRFSKA